jgi:hypothetical protein
MMSRDKQNLTASSARRPNETASRDQTVSSSDNASDSVQRTRGNVQFAVRQFRVTSTATKTPAKAVKKTRAETRSLFLFSDKNIVRRLTLAIVEWQYPLF